MGLEIKQVDSHLNIKYMKKFEQLRGWEDSDFEDYPKSKPVVKLNVIRLAVFCVVLVVFLAGVVWKIVNG